MKQCPQCGLVKPETNYYKNKTKKDGLQRCCKECCNINSKKFRETNPKYYWGEQGYFTQRYEETMEYIKESCRANKSSKVYKIVTPDGVYIGSTKRNLNLRMNTHLADFKNRFLKLGINVIPLLYQSFSKYSMDEVRTFLRNRVLLEEFDGTTHETKGREDFWMEHYRGMGFNMLNTYRAIGRNYHKKEKEILKNQK